MAIFRTTDREQEKLVPEDGSISAQSLLLDRESSQIAFETATFGIG
ncbi:MAG: hypothetical protein ACI9R3_004668 [Verrucomicrobiales bacterium]|jgi:hypothetical protein